MIINDQIASRRKSKRHVWSESARNTILEACAEPGATARSVAKKYDGLLDGGMPLTHIQVRSVLRAKHYQRGPNRRHIWSNYATNLLIHCVRDLHMNSHQVAALYNGKLDGGQKLTPSKVRGLVSRHDPAAHGVPARIATQVKSAASPIGEITTTIVKPSKPSLLRMISTNMPPQKDAVIRPFSPPRQPVDRGLAALFIDNLGDDQCRYIASKTADGISICCGAKCQERPKRRPGGSPYYSWCSEHIGKMLQVPASDQNLDRYVRQTARLSEAYG